MTRSVEVYADDCRTNVSDEIWRAFNESGTPIGSSARLAAAEGEPSEPVDRTALQPDQVECMLSDNAWTLVVPVGDVSEALDQHKLAQVVKSTSSVSVGPARVNLRTLSEEEKVALGAVRDAAAGTLRWLREGLSLKLVDLVATAGGAFGYVAAKDRLARPGLMVAAGCVALAALVLAIILDLLPGRLKVVKLSRLDLVRVHYGKMVTNLAWASRICVVGVLLAIVLAFFAAVPGEPSSTPSAAISTPSVTQAAGGALSIEVSVTWKDLDRDARAVRTTILQGDATLLVRQSSVSDGAAEQKLETEVPKAGDVEVRTTALDDAGRQVGDGVSRVFAVRG